MQAGGSYRHPLGAGNRLSLLKLGVGHVGVAFEGLGEREAATQVGKDADDRSRAGFVDKAFTAATL